MSVGTRFAHKSQATFFGRTCLVVRRWSQALRGGATRCAQTYHRLFPCVARRLAVPPQAAQYLTLPLLRLRAVLLRSAPVCACRGCNRHTPPSLLALLVNPPPLPQRRCLFYIAYILLAFPMGKQTNPAWCICATRDYLYNNILFFPEVAPVATLFAGIGATCL